MNAQRRITLRMLERADKEILKLSRTEKGAVFEFQHKFRQNPESPGLRLKPLSGDSRLWSARVTQDYRALLLRVAADDYLLVSVRHRSEVYEDLSRFSYTVNRVTGGIEVIDLGAVGDSLVDRVLPPDVGRRAPSRTGAVESAPIFDGVSDELLREYGVAETLLPLVRLVRTDEQLLALAEHAPQLSTEVLLALRDGRSHEEILDVVTAPVRADDAVDPEDFETAARRPATQVTSDDEALQAVLEESFARWQIFLHPTQRKIVERRYSGPTRVSGGPGTGKTIVALHRARHLAERLEPGADTPVLLTTYTRNLAADLRDRLHDLCEPDVAARIDVVNIDALARRVADVTEGKRRRIIPDGDILPRWQELLAELPATPWPAEFLAEEWTDVIVGQALDSRSGYFQARRAGRGRALTRRDRAEVWQLAERFARRLDDDGKWTWAQVAQEAARIETARARRAVEAAETGASSGSFQPHRYRHVVVDEAQDLRPAHWTMLRAMVAPGPDDMFLAGDTHQRIYGQPVTLGSLGVNIRGRSTRLTLSYRSTREILGWAARLLAGETYDDLDGGTDDLVGYRSVLLGQDPVVDGATDVAGHDARVVEQVRRWGAGDDGTLAVCVGERRIAQRLLERLAAEEIAAVEIGPDGPTGREGVHVGTMHRFKGLEYQRIVLADVSQGIVPRGSLERLRHQDSQAYRRERQKARSLLFVAATRARDDLAVFWHGSPSPFLPG